MSDALDKLISVLESNLKPVGDIAQRHANEIHELLIGPSKQIDRILATFVQKFDAALHAKVDPVAEFLEEVYEKLQQKIFGSKEAINKAADFVYKMFGSVMEAANPMSYIHKQPSYPNMVEQPNQMSMFSMSLSDLRDDFRKFGAAALQSGQKSAQDLVKLSADIWKAIDACYASMIVSGKAAVYELKQCFSPKTQEVLDRRTQREF